ncbi:cupin domain-containing protein [Alteraurantiacibacter palmitatis]|uniref:Cupin domain-containing protein n=1 Tax=Alteraurantiacibacter palmitatis TaxID=2054628 RepID=A0ABV7E4B8_9SPHN
MDIVHCAEMPWGESLVAQRGATDGMAHKRIFEGEEGSPDNFMLVMSREPSSYFSPRHRHPWDQIRFCLEGKIPIAKGLYVEGGEIAYFPEGAHYGPQEGGTDRIVLLLQFGGASGQGFIGPDRLKSARLEMEKAGAFARGVYTVETPQGVRNTDAYEAVWAHEKGAAPAYAEPAYKTPVVMRPVALAWEPAGAAGLSCKRLGVFPHRGLDVTQWRVAAGSQLALEPGAQLRFVFVSSGAGTANGTQVRRWSALRVNAGEEVTLVADETLELLVISLRLMG